MHRSPSTGGRASNVTGNEVEAKTNEAKAAEVEADEGTSRASSPSPVAAHRAAETGTARWPGLLLTAGLAVLAVLLSQVELIGETLHLGPIVLAILLGAALRNVAPLPGWLQPGIRVSVKQVLSAAIILLGFELSLAEVVGIGAAGLAVVSLVVVGALAATYAISRRLGLGRKLSVLIATGCSICGASAVAAADSIIRADDEDTAYAVAVVSALGTLSMFALPLAQVALSLPETVYGAWAGASIHSVGQAVAAGLAVSTEAGKAASLVKLTRVTFIAPITLGLSLLYAYRLRIRTSEQARERGGSQSAALASKVTVPWFVLGFIAVIGINSLGVLPPSLTDMLIHVDTFLLAMAMAAMGLEIRLTDMRQVGLTPLWAGGLATAFITLIALGLTLLLF